MKKLAILAALLIPGGVLSHVNAQEGCSAANLRGIYSFVASGAIVNVPGFPAGPFVAAGRTVYDGNGGAQGEIQISLNGNIVVDTWHGTYSVDPATCSATKTIKLDTVGAALHFYITVGAYFQELRFIATDSGTAISGTARRL